MLIKYPNYIKQITINEDGFPPVRKDYIAEKNQMLKRTGMHIFFYCIDKK